MMKDEFTKSVFVRESVIKSVDNLLPPFIFIFLQVVDVTIHFNDQPRLVTIKIDNESLNDQLPLKMDFQFVRL